MKELINKLKFGKTESKLFAQYTKYSCNDRLAIEIVDDEGEQWLTATVNIIGEEIPEDAVFIKNYSENEGMLETLIASNVIEPTPIKTVQSGWVNISAYKLKNPPVKPKWLSMYEENEALNLHAENALLMASIFGTEEELNLCERNLANRNDNKGDEWMRVEANEIGQKYYRANRMKMSHL